MEATKYHITGEYTLKEIEAINKSIRFFSTSNARIEGEDEDLFDFQKKFNKELDDAIAFEKKGGIKWCKISKKLKNNSQSHEKIRWANVVLKENKKLKEENQKLREVKNKRTEKMGKIIYDISNKLEELKFEVSLGDLLERAD